MLKLIRWPALTLLVAAALAMALPFFSAGASVKNSTTSASKAPVTQSYGTSSVVQKGMIVRLDGSDGSKVAPLSQSEDRRMFGVAVAANDAALSLTSNLNERQVYVATYGRYRVLVSTQNGPINSGDLISVSSLDGIGMKADSEAATVVGKTLTSFDGKSNVLGTAGLTDTNGNKTEVSLGRVMVQIQVQANPLQTVTVSTAFSNFLSRLGYSISDKKVSLARLYLAVLLFLITTVVSAVLLFSGVKSAMTAIGRNPLAKKSIYRSLIQVVISGLIVFVVGIFATYLLLKL